MGINPLFEKVINHVNNYTNLVVIDPCINPISVSGHVGDKSFIYLGIQMEETGEFLCSGAIQYNTHDYDWVEVLKISNTVKTETEVMGLIDKYIGIARKLSKTMCQLEQELEV